MNPLLAYFTRRRPKVDLVVAHLRHIPAAELSAELQHLVQPNDDDAPATGTARLSAVPHRRRDVGGAVWAAAARQLRAAGDWERALAVVARLREIAPAAASPQCAATQRAPSSSSCDGIRSPPAASPPVLATVPTLSYVAQQERTSTLFERYGTAPSPVEKYVQVLRCYAEWEAKGQSPRLPNGDLRQRPSGPARTADDPSAHGSCSTASTRRDYYDVLGHVKQALLAELRGPAGAARLYADVLRPLSATFSRYTAVLLRDERLVAALVSALPTDATGSTTRPPAPLLVVVSALTEILLDAATTAREKTLQQRSAAPLRDAAWRASAALWRAASRELSRRPVASTEAGATLAPLLRTLLRALRDLAGESEATGAVLRGVRETVNGVCIAGLRSPPPHTTKWGWDFFAPLLSALAALGMDPPNGVLHSLLVLLPAPLPSRQLLGRDLPAAGPAKAAGLWPALWAYAAAAPTDRWCDALAALEAAERCRAIRIAPAHLRVLLHALRQPLPECPSPAWEPALRCVGALLPKLQQTQQISRPNAAAAAGRGRGRNTAASVVDAGTQALVLMSLKAQSWERAFHVLSLFPSRPTPLVLLRHLHLVAALHAPWTVALAWMQLVRDAAGSAAREEDDGVSRAAPATRVHFMHHLYCLHAAAAAGQWEVCEKLYLQLPHSSSTLSVFACDGVAALEMDAVGAAAPPSHTITFASPRNAFTTAVAGVALLDHGHYRQAACFGCSARRAALQPASRGKTTTEDVRTALTLEFLGLLLAEAHAELREWIRDGWGPQRDTRRHPIMALLTLGEIVSHALLLISLLGLQHLEAPIRLIAAALRPPALPAPSRADDRLKPRREGVDRSPPVAALDGLSRSPRRLTYVPPAHARRQHERLALALGKFFRTCEADLQPEWGAEAGLVLNKFGVGALFLHSMWC